MNLQIEALRWDPLLVEVTSGVQNWTVFKHVDRALSGQGDLDAAAPRRSWDVVTATVADRFLGPDLGRWSFPVTMCPTCPCFCSSIPIVCR